MTPSTAILPQPKRPSLGAAENAKKMNATTAASMYHSTSIPSTNGVDYKFTTEQESPLLKAEIQRCRDDLEILKMTHGENSPKLAETENRLGLLYQHMARDYDTALEHHLEALRILYEAAGTERPLCKLFARDIAYTLVDIAMIHETRAENKMACEKYREAVTLFAQARIIETDAQWNAAKCGLERVGPHL
mmetsp:Transcript_24005/g.37075  ORF Transcript_24005/g.37075 Transcript_24005/m.37075 type:complete len:191 (-) Transcript_24005:109-681(-)|eukprot:CAMPEP_0195285738 /NCGR_PEP_ID=MMETSP0707-20130614/3465_1 /TAXON_ID=33640 /ORGANISM="Asterionellopsis glacialis, Strain CCMP134" /LENGTH=190 /DNA_ID=CAMNT_0040345281 /DNA_START=59 /DNA_END=631 /DNA_ORIENTATION=-